MIVECQVIKKVGVDAKEEREFNYYQFSVVLNGTRIPLRVDEKYKRLCNYILNNGAYKEGK